MHSRFKFFNFISIVNYWPSQENSRSTVTIEYSCVNQDISLRDVIITIPCPVKESPSVTHVDGEYSFEAREQILVWHIDKVSGDDSGLLEYSFPIVDSLKLYPVRVSFRSTDLFSGLVLKSVGGRSDQSVEYSSESMVTVDEYLLGAE